MTRARAWLLAAAALAAGGCPDSEQSFPGLGGGAAQAGRVDRVDLHAAPTAMNWDDRPGPDGIATQVYLYRVTNGKVSTVPVAGALEFVLYDGNVSQPEMAGRSPWRTWRFAPGDVAQYAARNMIGGHYAVPLRWGPRSPRGPLVTLMVRYEPRQGKPLSSKPMGVRVGQ